jgi:hypothetical protein
MQSLLNEPQSDETWNQIAPLLEAAMDSLGERDRNAVVLRYLNGKSLSEVSVALGASEDAVKMRVTRAVEKLRKFFVKRGVTLSAVAIGGAMTANSVQAAPVGLAVTVAATAVKGAAAGGSILTLVKGALQLMAWTKAKTAIGVTAAVLATGTTTVVVTNVVTGLSGSQTQRLPDGSSLVLNRVSIDGTNKFIHGRGLEKLLKNAIPTNGLQLPQFKLSRPTMQHFEAPLGKRQLVAELKVTGNDLANHPLVKPAFYREFRCVIRGERGIEYVQEFWAGKFQSHSDGYFGYVIANNFPRDSRWLWLRVERRKSRDQGGPWTVVAEFKIENTLRSPAKPWVAEPVHVAKTVDGMDFILGEITVVTQAYSPRDIWNHIVTTPFQVRSNGVVLTNWSAAYVRVEDASGNWDYHLASHRGLDPRFVWKLEADFEPQSDFPPESMATVNLSGRSSSITASIMNVPVKISWDGYWVDVNMPTNRTDLALHFICVTDENGNKSVEPGSGSWGRHSFRKGSFMFRDGDALTMAGTPTTMTFAIVPNIHATFYAQPRLVTEQ